jgi:hypothetical protein
LHESRLIDLIEGPEGFPWKATLKLLGRGWSKYMENDDPAQENSAATLREVIGAIKLLSS